MKMTREEFLDNIMIRQEAERHLGIARSTMQYYVEHGHIKPCKTVENSPKKTTHIFWKPEILAFKKEIENKNQKG